MLHFFMVVNWNYGGTLLSYLFLNLEEGKRDENDDSDFKILVNFDAAIIKE